MARESLKNKRVRGERILAGLHKLYPDAGPELDYTNHFELLIAVVLSAQATDVSVNLATPQLFAAYPDAFAMAQATPEEIEPHIRTIGLFRSKAKNCVATAKILAEEYDGNLPTTFEELIKLPGVGRKTANVVLSAAFNVPAIAVDTHVGRLARRLGFSKEENPDKVEKDLQKIFPEDSWIFLHHGLILHGRRCCTARKPDCASCLIAPDCPSAGKFP